MYSLKLCELEKVDEILKGFQLRARNRGAEMTAFLHREAKTKRTALARSLNAEVPDLVAAAVLIFSLVALALVLP